MDFGFYSRKFDYWPIYEAIKEYYLIGVENTDWEMYSNYPGFRRKTELSVQHIHQESDLNRSWNQFLDEIKQLAGLELVNTTLPYDSCLSGYILLDSKSIEGVSITRELHFYLSFLGPFYSVVGQDRYYERKPDLNIVKTTCLTVSPKFEYEELFCLLEKKIEERFIGYRFVPFRIGELSLKGLNVDDSDGKNNKIFHALFTSLLDFSHYNVGDGFYKNEDWIRNGYVDDGQQWTASPIWLVPD